MEPMQFTEISTEDKKTLLETAINSIKHGLQFQRALPVDIKNYPPLLQQQGASFVTLNLHKQLRGCIGSLSAYQPLLIDVVEHAYDAAFKDPRFSPVKESEVDQLDIHISILTPAVAMQFSSEEDLLSQLKPGIDGLILEDDFHRATFLPSVWDQLQTPQDFLNHLKVKAGLNINDWPESIRISRYQTISVE